MTLLPHDDIQSFIDDHSEWTWSDKVITKTYEFGDFAEAMEFVKEVANKAEAADHHPDIDIRWNKVTLALSTHSEGGLTNKDLDLAAACDSIAS